MGFATESMLKLEQRFDPRWFLPEDSHLAQFFAAQDTYYPNNGFYSGLYMGSVNYSQEIIKIREAGEKLEGLTNITYNVMPWVEPFRDFVWINFQKGKHFDIQEV